MSLLVDTSHHQNDAGTIDWPAVRNYVDGGFYTKVTQGTSGDSFVDSKWKVTHDALQGEMRAPYHFIGYRGNWQRQVADFIAQYSQRAWEWGPVFDIEFDPAKSALASDVTNVVGEWRRQTGLRFCYVYVGKADLTGGCKPQDWIDVDMRIIAARYFQDDYKDAFTNLGWDHPQLDIVQYWNAGNITGFPAPVDVNRLRDRRALISAWNYNQPASASAQQRFLLVNG